MSLFTYQIHMVSPENFFVKILDWLDVPGGPLVQREVKAVLGATPGFIPLTEVSPASAQERLQDLGFPTTRTDEDVFALGLLHTAACASNRDEDPLFVHRLRELERVVVETPFHAFIKHVQGKPAVTSSEANQTFGRVKEFLYGFTPDAQTVLDLPNYEE